MVAWIQGKQLCQADRDRLCDELDWDGCLDKAGLNAVQSAVDAMWEPLVSEAPLRRRHGRIPSGEAGQEPARPSALLTR